MHARRVVVLPDLRQAEPQILDAADPFGAIDHAALRGRHDLATRQVDGLHAHSLIDFGDDAGLPAFQALEVGEVPDRPLEPAERLRAGATDRERHHVELEDVAVELPVQIHPAALVHPAEKVEMIHAERPGGRG